MPDAKTMGLDPMLSTAAAAQMLSISLGTMRRWADEQYVASYRTPGGQRRFRQSDLDAFIQRMKDAGSPGPPE
jgi:excisionase family DNA binding protein